jgi:hypothetical protein
MDWNVAQAKQRLSQVIRAAATEPQRIFRRSRMVAAVVDGDTFEDYLAWKHQRPQRSIGDDLAELRALFLAEGYELPVVERRDRPNPFAETPGDGSSSSSVV